MAGEEITHPINYASRRTGLSPHVIRAWERRYGAVTPQRSETNRRTYTDNDVERLRLLKALCDAGHSIGRIARLSDDELRGMLARSRLRVVELPRDRAAAPEDATTGADPGVYLDRCRKAVRDLDERGLRSALSEANVSLGQLRFLKDLVDPLMNWIGDNWHDGNLRIAQEHLGSAVMRSFLFGLQDDSDEGDGKPVIVVSTPQGHYHEIGAQVALLVAAMDGWRGVYLGPNSPAEEIAAAALTHGARAVGVSVVYLPDAGKFLQFAANLRQALPAAIDIIVGGAGAEIVADRLHATGVYYTGSIEEFRSALRESQSRAVRAE